MLTTKASKSEPEPDRVGLAFEFFVTFAVKTIPDADSSVEVFLLLNPFTVQRALFQKLVAR